MKNGTYIRDMDNDRLARFLFIWNVNFLTSFLESGFTKIMAANDIREWLDKHEWDCPAVHVGDDFIFNSEFELKEIQDNETD